MSCRKAEDRIVIWTSGLCGHFEKTLTYINSGNADRGLDLDVRVDLPFDLRSK